jgi:5-methyltetrahydropteroyltriglutamate--homocysteine methyltransferase
MKRSTDRILVYHAGALAKPDDVREMVAAKEAGRPYDKAVFARRLRESVAEQVQRQIEIGFDFVNDGEQSKGGFSYYIAPRLGGIVERDPKPGEEVLQMDASARDRAEFPEYFSARGGRSFHRQLFFAEGPISYTGQETIKADTENFAAALERKAYSGAILPVVAVGSMEHWIRNLYYASQEDFLFALADAMHQEYKAITDAGFIVQIDDPDLPHAWQHVSEINPDWTVRDYQKYAELRVEALNRSIGDIPEDRVIVHFCWGGDRPPSAPHKNDLPLEHVIDILYTIKAQAYSIAAANPRHEWEWIVFKDHKLPEGKILMPGMITQYTDTIEHPETVAQRLMLYAGVVGKENVMTGSDCGVGSRVSHPSIGWAKFQSMVEGARLASARLWGHGL